MRSFKLQGVEASLTIGELKKKCQEVSNQGPSRPFKITKECGLDVTEQRLFLKGKLLKER